MSWSVTFIGKSAAVAAALEAQAAKLSGQSKAEYEDALPHLLALVGQNFTSEEYRKQYSASEPLLKFSASGSGTSRGETQLHRSCSVSLESIYGVLVD